MFPIAERYISIMVIYAISLHLAWAFILLIDESAVNATALNALYRYIHPPIFLAVAVAAAALLALVAVFTRPSWTLVLLLPQQVLLMMSAAGAIEAIWTAQFADGVVRTRGFIAADQFYSVLAAIGHTAAIILQARSRGA